MPLQFGLKIGACSRKDNSPHCGHRDLEGDWLRGREKKDKEEEVSSSRFCYAGPLLFGNWG